MTFKQLSEKAKREIFLLMFDNSNGFKWIIKSDIYEDINRIYKLSNKQIQSLELKFSKLFL